MSLRPTLRARIDSTLAKMSVAVGHDIRKDIVEITTTYLVYIAVLLVIIAGMGVLLLKVNQNSDLKQTATYVMGICALALSSYLLRASRALQAASATVQTQVRAQAETQQTDEAQFAKVHTHVRSLHHARMRHAHRLDDIETQLQVLSQAVLALTARLEERDKRKRAPQ